MTYAKGDATKARLIAVALRCARGGLHHVTPRYVAELDGSRHWLVHYHFGGAAGLLDAVADEAVRTGDAMVICRLILDDHPAVSRMTPAERLDWFKGIAASKVSTDLR